MTDKIYVELSDVTKTFDDFVALDHVSLAVREGSLTALLGPSGSGKTTILRMIAGLEMPDTGEISIDGKRVNEIPASKRGIGFLFQNYALFSHSTVRQNIAFGLEVMKQPKAEIEARVDELLELVGLQDFGSRYPGELSGGQKQRVAFARALAPRPRLLLLDEPFAAIDAKVRNELRSWLREMIYRVKITSIFVTHDQDEAVEVADTIIMTNHGKVEQIGTSEEIYRSPKTSFVAGFVGRSVTIPDAGTLSGFEKYHRPAIIRPEYVEAFKSDNRHFADVLDLADDAVVKDVRFRGSYEEVILEVNGNELVVKRSLERRSVTVGESMHVIVYRILLVEGERIRIVENEPLKHADRLYSIYNW